MATAGAPFDITSWVMELALGDATVRTSLRIAPRVVFVTETYRQLLFAVAEFDSFLFDAATAPVHLVVAEVTLSHGWLASAPSRAGEIY